VLEQAGPALLALAQPKVALVILLSGLFGLFLGAMPGLTATMGAALLVPFAFFLDPLPALASIVTMSAMAIFAGDIPAALVRMPGTPSSAAYVDDSYRLAQKGQLGLVLGVDVVSSVIGGLMGAAVLIVAAPLLAEFALNFSSFEYFWLAVMGLSCAVLISPASPVKGLISLLIGLLLATVGIDVAMGYPRFTFGVVDLLSGISFIPAMIGLFAVSEVFRNVMVRDEDLHPMKPPRRIFTGVGRVLWRYRLNVLRSGGIGTFIGVLPGAGADIAAWLAYAVSKKNSRDAKEFGKGHIEPIVDAGTANNSSLAGDWVPALVFGIPGDSITAVVIGVLYMKGLRPGPMIFEQEPTLVYSVYLTFILANLLLVPLGWLAIRASGLILGVPRRILMPAILTFCMVGAYAINNNLFDVGIMLAAGVLGYALERFGFPVAPVVLGLVLGPIVEQHFMTSAIKSHWDLTAFFGRPIGNVLAAFTIGLWLLPLVSALRARYRAPAAP
jgi:putative tricarboxylic transport membrane protein